MGGRRGFETGFHVAQAGLKLDAHWRDVLELLILLLSTLKVLGLHGCATTSGFSLDNTKIIMCLCIFMSHDAYVGVKVQPVDSQLCSSTMWVLSMDLRSSGLVISVLTH